jgi:hypothetical protein
MNETVDVFVDAWAICESNYHLEHLMMIPVTKGERHLYLDLKEKVSIYN